MLCNKCEKEQPETEFYLKWKDKDIRHKICRTCKKEWAQTPHGRSKRHKYNASKKGKKSVAKYRKETSQKRKDWYRKYADSGRQRDIKLRSCYDITLDDYKKMFSQQKGVCAICGEPETAKWAGKIKPLSVDHNHDTGDVRALLCFKCNMGISQFRENITYMANAIAYIEKYKSPAEAIGNAV